LSKVTCLRLTAVRLTCRQHRTTPAGQILGVAIPATPAALTLMQSQTADSAPGVATWGVTFSARKVVPCVRWPATGITARTVYSRAQGCVCTALQVGGDVERPWLLRNMTSSIKTEVGNTHKKFGDDRTHSSRDMIADIQTHRHAHHNTPRCHIQGGPKSGATDSWP